MPSLTTEQRINRIITLSGVYDVVLKLSRGFFARAIEWSRDEVFWGAFESRQHLFQATDTLDDQEALPSGWLGFIEAHYTNSGTVTPFRYITPKEIPGIRLTDIIKAVAADPCCGIWNKKFNTFPTAINGSTVTFYKHPVPLYGAAESTTDTMPIDLEPLITRGAFERLLKMQVEEKVALKLTTIEIEATERAQSRLYEEMARELNANPMR